MSYPNISSFDDEFSNYDNEHSENELSNLSSESIDEEVSEQPQPNLGPLFSGNDGKLRLAKLITDNDSRVKVQKKTGTTQSSVWDNFNQIFFGNSVTNWVQCDCCKNLLASKNGTSSLARHLENYCKGKGKGSQTTLVTEAERAVVKDLGVVLCASELRPFSLFDGKAFTALCQEMVNIGAKHGAVSINTVLPKGKTIARHTEWIYSEIKTRISKELAKVHHLSISTDHWTDKMKHRSFLGLNVMYISEAQVGKKTELKVVNRAVAVRPMSTKQCEPTAKLCKQILAEYGVPFSKVSAVVTDNALKSAFLGPVAARRKREVSDDVMWFACSSHDINLLHDHVFCKKDQELGEIMEQLNVCKSIVATYKSTNKLQFKKELKQHCETRWDSRYSMINSVVENWSEIQGCSHDSIDPIVGTLDLDLLTQLRDYLEECLSLRLFVSVQDEPSFCRLLPARQSLISVGEEHLTGGLAPLKPRFNEFLHKIKITATHKAASLLCPRFKDSTAIFSSEDKHEAKEELQRIFYKMEDSGIYLSPSRLPTEPKKKSKEPKSLQKLMGVTESAVGDNLDIEIEMEIECYCCKEFDPATRSLKVLEFWKDQQSTFPKLAAVAIYLLSIPATNNATERLFSQCKLVYGQTRTSLSVRRFEHLVVIQNNADLAGDLRLYQPILEDSVDIDDDDIDLDNFFAESDEEDFFDSN